MKKFEKLFCSLLLFCSILQAHTDLIVFSYDRPLQLYALLESIELNLHDYGQIFVIYRTSGNEYQIGYEKVFNRFQAIPVRQNNRGNDFKKLVIECFKNCKNDHILFAVDDIIMTAPVFLDDCIAAMKRFNAYAFYLRLGSNLSYCYAMNMAMALPRFSVNSDYLVWNLNAAQGDWGYPNTVDLAVYKKSDIAHIVEGLSYSNPNTFEGNWAGKRSLNNIGICYQHSKMINIPLNCVQNVCNNRNMNFANKQELLDMFSQGKKINIEALQGINNPSCHIDIVPEFVER